MNKPIGSLSLAFVFLTILLSGSSPAPTPGPPTPTITPIPFSFFDPQVPPPAGKEITVTGVIEFNTPEKNPNVFVPFARLKVTDGEFEILLDDVGEQLAKQFDGRTVEVQGILTGEAVYDMVTTLSGPTSGNVSGVMQVPELKVINFKEVP